MLRHFQFFVVSINIFMEPAQIRDKFWRDVIALTLKAPRKTASENVVCLCRLLNILADFSNLFFCIQTNSVDPDQTAPRGAV